MSRNLGTLTLDLAVELSEYRKGMDQASRIADRNAKEMQRIMNDMNRRQEEALERATRGFRALAGIAASVAAVSTVRGVLDMADSYGQMSARIKLTIEDMEEYDYVQKRLMQTANDAQRPLEEIQSIFIDTSGNLRDMGYSLEQAMDIADSFSYALVRNATDARKAASALHAYDIALNKKVVGSREWHSISSALPSIENSLSKIFDIPMSKIQQMGHAGEITIDMLNKGFLKAYQDNKEAAASMGSTIEGSFIALQNQVKEYIGKLNESTGATEAISNSIGFLGDHVETLGKTFGVVATGGLTLYASKLLATTVSNAKATISTLQADMATRKRNLALIEESMATEKKLLADIKALHSNKNLSSSYTLLTAATMDYHRALAKTQQLQSMTKSGLGLITGALGGPVGLIALAASAASAFYLFSDSAKDTKVELDKLSQPLEEILNKFRELNEIQRDNAVREYQEQELAAYKQLAEERDKLWKKLSYSVSEKIPNGSYLITEIREEFKQILDEAERTGRNISRVIDDQAKKYNFSDKVIEDLKVLGKEYDKQLTIHNKAKEVLDNILSLHKSINEETRGHIALLGQIPNYLKSDIALVGPLVPDSEYLNELNKIFDKRKEINDKANEAQLIQDFLNGKLTDSNEKLRASLLYQQRINDELIKNAQQTDNIVRKMTELDDRIAKAGMSYKDAFIYDLKKEGASDDQIREAEQKLDTLASKTEAVKTVKSQMVDLESEYKRIMESTLSDEVRRGLELEKNLDILKKVKASEEDMLAVRRAAYESMSVDLPGYSSNGDTLTAQLARISENISELDKWREEQLQKIQQAYGDEESALAESIARKEEIEQQYRDRRAQYEGELNQELLNMAQSLSSDTLSALETAGLESTGIYKAMFLANKATAFANAVVSAQVAGVKAMEAYSSVNPTMAMAMGKMITGVGMVNAGIIAGTALRGFSSGGYTGSGGKYEPAGIVHAGEVVFSQEDVKRLGGVNAVEAIRLGKLERFAQGGFVGLDSPKIPEPKLLSFSEKMENYQPEINITVYVNEDGESDAEAYDGLGKKIDERIKVTVKREIATAQRPGGVLARR